uniref:Uncharacterized protein n=1 Tax=Oryza glaberrima TaxID=4538 RepID=I1QGT3_ORYGL
MIIVSMLFMISPDLRGVDYYPYCAWIHADCSHLEVRFLAVHDPRHRDPQRRNDHDNIQGQGEAVAAPGQLEAAGDLHHRHRLRHLPRRHDRPLLLGHEEHRFLHQHVPCEATDGEGRDDVGTVPAGEHHQPGAHLRDALPQLVLRRAPRHAALRRLRSRADHRDAGDGVRHLGVRPYQGHRLGVGRRHLALQHRHLPPPRHLQVRRPLRPQRPRLGHPHRAQDCLHEQEGLRERGEGGAVGDGAEDAARAADAGDGGPPRRRRRRRAEQLQGALGDRRAGQAPRRGGPAARAQHAQGPDGVHRQAQGPRHGQRPAPLHRLKSTAGELARRRRRLRRARSPRLFSGAACMQLSLSSSSSVIPFFYIKF